MSAGIKHCETQSVISHYPMASTHDQYNYTSLACCFVRATINCHCLHCTCMQFDTSDKQLYSNSNVKWGSSDLHSSSGSGGFYLSHISLVISYSAALHCCSYDYTCPNGGGHCCWDHRVLKVSNNEWNFPPNVSYIWWVSFNFNGWNDACLHGTHFLLSRLIMIWRYMCMMWVWYLNGSCNMGKFLLILFYGYNSWIPIYTN